MLCKKTAVATNTIMALMAMQIAASRRSENPRARRCVIPWPLWVVCWCRFLRSLAITTKTRILGAWSMGGEAIFHKSWIDSLLLKASVSLFFLLEPASSSQLLWKGLIKIDLRATLELLRIISRDGIYKGDMGYLDAFGYKRCINRDSRCIWTLSCVVASQHEAQVLAYQNFI